MSSNVVSLQGRRQTLQQERDHQRKEKKVEELQQRFAQALPDKPKPVRAYLNKKRAQKKPR
ncbi:tRNA (uracil-5-)-methyltransferase [Bacterioplanes sanyensis]|uniref:tRNA (Uracil-5-)-methyltransferase n=1 Tax=Bacterioplanes sanyensis TaxID=1249553 RepID=A0A222FME4_9GAMM|nr:hypothetical protein [Bacterioplanes sanyensis]ASP40197.1 tRNA (uracil-5-)-methyltransferase [Bacterioplanes sanyensis]